jgi:hypothetical protein
VGALTHVLAVGASHSATLTAAIIGAAGSVFTALVAGFFALRAQSYKQQLDDFAQIVDKACAKLAEEIKQALRDGIGTHPQRRRWYE